MIGTFPFPTVKLDTLDPLFSIYTPALRPFQSSKESWFFMREGQKFERQDETSEKLQLAAKADVDPTLLAALTDENSGILKPGMLPKVDCSTSNGTKELLNSINQVGRKGREFSTPRIGF